jgi:hypothetical protein
VARFNPKKSKALAIGRWKESATVLVIESRTHVKILGVTYGNYIAESAKECWAHVTRTVTVQARNACARDLCLAR